MTSSISMPFYLQNYCSFKRAKWPGLGLQRIRSLKNRRCQFQFKSGFDLRVCWVIIYIGLEFISSSPSLWKAALSLSPDHKPPTPLKVGKPDGADRPAPVRTINLPLLLLFLLKLSYYTAFESYSSSYSSIT